MQDFRRANEKHDGGRHRFRALGPRRRLCLPSAPGYVPISASAIRPGERIRAGRPFTAPPTGTCSSNTHRFRPFSIVPFSHFPLRSGQGRLVHRRARPPDAPASPWPIGRLAPPRGQTASRPGPGRSCSGEVHRAGVRTAARSTCSSSASDPVGAHRPFGKARRRTGRRVYGALSLFFKPYALVFLPYVLLRRRFRILAAERRPWLRDWPFPRFFTAGRETSVSWGNGLGRLHNRRPSCSKWGTMPRSTHFWPSTSGGTA